jgi:uncharacterized surface protein with fasciclin (FAS1) repeats
MNFRVNIFVLLLAAGTACIVPACNDKWKEHAELSDPALGASLFERMQQEESLTKFTELVTKAGFKEVLSSSRKYTVWAPSNEALSALSQDIQNDNEKLKQFVAYHIAELSYNTNRTDTVRLQTLNGKYIHFSKLNFENAAIVSGNKFAGNGVLHVINKTIAPPQNIWDVISTSDLREKDYLNGLNYEVIDSAKAERMGVDPQTGKPIFKPGTGIVKKNLLFDRVGDLKSEDQEFTVILLTDAALEEERKNIKPYTVGSSTEETEKLASLIVMKDLVFKGKYTLDKLPSELVSIEGVKVPINKNAIQSSYETSNGMVYVLNQLTVPLANKIRNVRQEGENSIGFSRSDKGSNIAYRLRNNPNTGQLFNDIYIYNHKIPLFHVKYRLKDLFKIKYKVYWVAPNDVQTLTFKQRFAFADPNSTALDETQVNLKNFNEVLVGEITPQNFGDYNAYIVAANNGVDQTNSINVDYFRLEPQLP